MNNLAPRPRTASIAFWIWLMSAIVGMASVINMLVATNVLASMAATATEDIEAYFLVTGFGVVVSWIAVAGAALQAFLSVFFRDGHNWARIVLTVFAVLSLGLLVSDPGDLFTWIYVVANVVAVVCSFLPDSNAFFVGARRRRAAVHPVGA